MPISLRCPSCLVRVRLRDQAAGRRFRCPKCQGTIVVAATGPRKPSSPIVGPTAVSNPEFAPSNPGETQQITEPTPITSAAREASREAYNPFDDGSETDDDASNPRGRRLRKRKEDFNPFAESPSSPSEAHGDAADREQLFDFGAVEPESPPVNEFDFGKDPGSDPPRRRR